MLWGSESRVLGRWKGVQPWNLRVQESIEWRESRGLRDMGKREWKRRVVCLVVQRWKAMKMIKLNCEEKKEEKKKEK